MRFNALIFSVMIVAAVGSTFAQRQQGQGGGGGTQAARGPAGPGLTLTTTAFPDGGEVPAKYTQADPNAVSPKLDWTNVPNGVATFALIFHDPDVALQRKADDVLHWMVFNIPGTSKGLPEA